jgi:hypothetical protein
VSAKRRIIDELEKDIDLRRELIIAGEDFASMLYADFRPVKKFMSFGDGSDSVIGEILALQRDDVDASRSSRKTLGQHVWWHILEDSGKSTNKAIATDGGEVMDGDAAAQGCVVLNANMSA